MERAGKNCGERERNVQICLCVLSLGTIGRGGNADIWGEEDSTDITLRKYI